MTTAPYHAIVYGPIKSRRLGLSLGINPTPTPREACPPGCLFCEKGAADTVPIISRVRGIPSAGVVVTSVARRVIEMSKAGEKLDSITVAGNGDPTLHPALMEISQNLSDLRNKWFPKADLCLISNSRSLASNDLRHTVNKYDQPILRFEWGTAKTHAAFVPESELDYKTLVERLMWLEHGKWIAQATLVTGTLDNSSDKELAAWMKKLEELRPREVHLTTVEAGRKSSGVKGLPVARLEQIAAKLIEKLGLAVTVVAREAQPA